MRRKRVHKRGFGAHKTSVSEGVPKKSPHKINIKPTQKINFTADHVFCCCFNQTFLLVGWVLLYVHRNRRLFRDGSPGRPPRLSHSSRVLFRLGRRVPLNTVPAWSLEITGADSSKSVCRLSVALPCRVRGKTSDQEANTITCSPTHYALVLTIITTKASSQWERR